MSRSVVKLQKKISRTRDRMREEQKTQDGNVDEYLKLITYTDAHQHQRVKTVFEKKNKKSAHTIWNLQKKLERYSKRLTDVKMKNSQKQGRELGLKNVGDNIRNIMSTPKQLVHKIKNKFGSDENVHRPTWYDEVTEEEPEIPKPTAVVVPISSEEGSECSSVTSESVPSVESVLKPIYFEMQEHRDEQLLLHEKMHCLQNEMLALQRALREERFRSERLEEQVASLTEIHENEVETLLQEWTVMEERVQYQNEESLRDMNDMVEMCNAKICKMEHQALQQQSSRLNEELYLHLENCTIRAVVIKLINVVLTVLQLTLLVVAAAAGIVITFLGNRTRVLTTIISAAAIFITAKCFTDVEEVQTRLVKQFLGVSELLPEFGKEEQTINID